jgi:hypothetical protein
MKENNEEFTKSLLSVVMGSFAGIGTMFTGEPSAAMCILTFMLTAYCMHEIIRDV